MHLDANAKLTPALRRLLVHRVRELGWRARGSEARGPFLPAPAAAWGDAAAPDPADAATAPPRNWTLNRLRLSPEFTLWVGFPLALPTDRHAAVEILEQRFQGGDGRGPIGQLALGFRERRGALGGFVLHFR